MDNHKSIKSALISVYYKDGLEPIIRKLNQNGVTIYSTGGTYNYIESLGIEAQQIEDLTGYPSILGGRVKTLHPKVFGGILSRREVQQDQHDMREYSIEPFDLVIVNLYPFTETVAKGASDTEIIEKIDIGGISLIRAAAKNFNHVLCASSPEQYPELLSILGNTLGVSYEDRLRFATYAFAESSKYDTAIFNYMANRSKIQSFRWAADNPIPLRYGENPHQEAIFFGDQEQVFTQLHGKELSYNNLLDLEAGINLISEFDETTFAILKHNNACGVSSRAVLVDAWKAALEADPISAYGGVLITNEKVDLQTAEEVNKLFFEIILAPGYENNALELLKSKKNRIILHAKSFDFQAKQFRSLLNGVLQQVRDSRTETPDDLNLITIKEPESGQMDDLLFANKIVKHSKSNAIVLASGKQMLASGIGQTSRVDALKQAIEKAHSFGLNLRSAVMASDAFFPFADSVEIAFKAGVNAVIQPGGSVRDNETIEYCNKNGISMFFTGVRHFKH